MDTHTLACQTPHETVVSILATVRDLLLDAGVQLERAGDGAIDDHAPEIDKCLRDGYELSEALRRYLMVHRPPKYDTYNPVEVIKNFYSQNPLGGKATPDPDVLYAVRLCQGDPEQVIECLRLAARNVELESGSVLRTEVTSAEGTPRIVLGLQGPGRFPEVFSFEGLCGIDLDAYGQRWIAATFGGNVAITDGAMVLYLEGDREVPEADPVLAATLRHVSRLARNLRSWRGAIGPYEYGCASPAETTALYRDTIADAVAELDRATA